MTSTIHFKIHLLDLHCYLSDESKGDEVFLKYDGKKIWPEKDKFVPMKGGSQRIGYEIEVERGSSVEIEIWDYDVLSANDKLGVVKLLADVQGGPFHSDMIRKDTQNAKYVLDWEVL